MIDEMYDRAWVEHRERFSKDAQALLRKAGGVLKFILKPGRPSARRDFAIPVDGREREEGAQ
ncbi:hypothetical protein JMG10_16945 [Nostoc ellipsosporum NOK]|nr:hypothetical protein [Nostoc ellipsosporum NOK]